MATPVDLDEYRQARRQRESEERLLSALWAPYTDDEVEVD